MTTTTLPVRLTPEDVQRASERDGKLYELVDGELKEKQVGFKSLIIAGQIMSRLNEHFFPHEGVAACEAMVYCFNGGEHGRNPTSCTSGTVGCRAESTRKAICSWPRISWWRCCHRGTPAWR